MKKYLIGICLSLSLVLAFSNAVLLPVQSSDAGTAVRQQENTGFSAHINYPETEIEHTTVHGFSGFNGQYAVQKTPAFYTANTFTRIPVMASVLYSPTVFEEKELFDNNYLSHNYPAHNFW